MLKRLTHLTALAGFVLALSPALAPPRALAQALPTATKRLDLQAGGQFVITQPDYTNVKFYGYGAYATLDFTKHFGLALDFRNAKGPQTLTERTYEAGVRYVRQYGKFHPYGKVMVGRGVFISQPFPNTNIAEFNLGYNMLGVGGGVDYNLRKHVNLRGDFEFQKWSSDPYLPNGLSPYVFTIGAAYHF